jgi:2-methylisocitrate lyase-like PEP mutase family enzyme
MAAMATHRDKAELFLSLHRGERPLLMPNPWDAGSAKVLASLGFQALATTSAGFAGTLGRRDGKVTRDEAVAHAATIVEAVDVPVSADYENGFADNPDDVRANAALAVGAGLAGFSIGTSPATWATPSTTSASLASASPPRPKRRMPATPTWC